MAKDANEIEVGIRRAVENVSPLAAGLWTLMRYVIEQDSERPGHLRQNGRALLASQIARRAGLGAETVAPLLQELDDAGLGGDNPHGWYSGLLAEKRQAAANQRGRAVVERLCPFCGEAFSTVDSRAKFCSHACKQAGYRARRDARDGSRDGSTRNASVTVTDDPSLSVTQPPPPVSPPTTPSSNPHPREGLAGESEVGDKPKKRSGPSAESVAVPASLDTPAFRAAWSKFLRHRSQYRVKLTAEAADSQLAKLEKIGVDRAVAAIEYSVSNGWQGIFEPKPEKGNQHGKPTAAADAKRAGQFAQSVRVKAFQPRGGGPGAGRPGGGPAGEAGEQPATPAGPADGGPAPRGDV